MFIARRLYPYLIHWCNHILITAASCGDIVIKGSSKLQKLQHRAASVLTFLSYDTGGDEFLPT